MNNKTWLALASFLMSPMVFGVQLIKDINAVPQTTESGFANFGDAVAVAQGTLFRMDDGIHGAELWVTNGTPAGTRLLKDIRPGPITSDPSNLTLVNGILFFSANDGANGKELWRSDGTADGTRMIANIGPGEQSLGQFQGPGVPLKVVNGVAYFSASDAAAGEELWRTDGTAAGTYRLADIRAGAEGSFVTGMMIVGSRLFFIAYQAQASRELWMTDGTPGGTQRVSAVPANTFGDISSPSTIAGNALFFVADDGVHGREVWRVTENGTAGMIADLNTWPVTPNSTNTRSADPGVLMPVGNGVVFSAVTEPGGIREYGLYRANAVDATITRIMQTSTQLDPFPVISLPGGLLFRVGGNATLWRTDGTAAGTGELTTANIGMPSSAIVYSGNEAFFFTNHPGAPTFDLWRTDGTVAGTREFAAIGTSASPVELAMLAGRAYFNLSTPAEGQELWTSDGTVGGTRLVVDSLVGLGSGAPRGLAALAGKLWFEAVDADAILQPWVTDGTEAGTIQLASIAAKRVTRDSEPVFLGNVGANAFFRADDGVNGFELWVTDGTPAGTRKLTNGQAADQVITPSQVVSLGNGIGLFELTDADGKELWRTDGTVAGTWQVVDLYPGPPGSSPFAYGRVVLNGVLYFGTPELTGFSLWRSDGTAAGTYHVATISSSASGDGMYVFPVTANSRVFISRSSSNPALISSDGTEAGTVVVQANVAPYSPFYSVEFQNRLCFTVNTAVHVSDIWCSDGTAGNYSRLTDFASTGLIGGRPFSVNGKLLVDAIEPGAVGGGLYATDGSPGGLHKISDRRIDTEGLSINGGAHHAWLVSDGPGYDIFITDGTQAGTHSLLTGATPNHAWVMPSIGEFNGSIVFWANDFTGTTGARLWKVNVDGTDAKFLADVDPSSGVSPRNFDNFVQLGSRLIYSGVRADIGEELWSITATEPNSTDDFATTALNAPVAISVLVNDGVFSGSVNAASLEVVSAPTSGTATVNAATGVINYAPNVGFSGLDTFTYRVAGTGGGFSNIATVSVTTLAAPSTTGPGTAPVPPPPPPPPPSGGGSSSGGGGGALGFELVPLALLLLVRRRRAHRL